MQIQGANTKAPKPLSKYLPKSLVHSNYGNKNVRIYSDNLIGLSIVLGDETAQKRCSDIVSENISLPSSINEAHPTSQKVKFLVPLMNKKFEGVFLKSLYHQLSLRRGLCSNNLLEYYYLMSDRQFKFLDAKPSGDLRLYRSTTILYNTIFSMKSLETFDLATSFEIKLRKLQKTSSAAKRLPHHTVHLVRLKPRLDIIDALDARSLMEFRFLVNQMMVKRISLVLPFMKNWFKNCDQDIARLGITEKTRSGDLDKEQFLQIYMYLKERNDYRRSTFLQAVECYDEVTPIYLQN